MPLTLSRVQTAGKDIPVHLECGDLAGWLDEATIREAEKAGLIAVQAQKHGVPRRVTLLAGEDKPMTPSARRQARASYAGMGGLRTTYHENLNRRDADQVVAPIVMLKRALSNGEFVKW